MIQQTVSLSYWGEFWAAFKDSLIEEARIGNIGKGISHVIEPNLLYTWDVAGLHIVVSDAVVASWFVMLGIFVLGYLLGRNMEPIPRRSRQTIGESFVDLLLSLCRSANMTEAQAEQVVPFVGTIAVFIALTNLSSMLKIAPPAKNPAFPIALALMTIVYVIAVSIHFVGLRGFWLSLIYPRAMMLPFKLLDFLIKPISLSLRLFGNVFGAFILMEFIYLVIPIILPGALGLWFDLADGLLQAVIFTYLTVTYIGEILESAHEAQHERQIRLTAKN